MCKTIKHRVKFRAHPERVYQLIADSKQHAKLTGQKAQISGKVGGAFSVQGGRVTGINVDLVPGERLVQAWRTKEFPVGIFSMVTLQISRTRTGTEVVLTHRGVPKKLIPKVESTWRELYWQRIREAHTRKLVTSI